MENFLTINLQELTVFIILAIIANMMPAFLPQGGEVTTAFIIELALIVIYRGPTQAALVSIISALVGNYISEIIEGQKLGFKKFALIMTDVLENVIVIFVVGYIYKLIEVEYLNFIVAVLVYFCLEVGFLAFNKSMAEKTAFINNFNSFGQTYTLNYLLLVPLAFFMGKMYLTVASGTTAQQVADNMKLFFILLFFVPLLLINYSVRLYMNMRRTYEQTIKSLAATIEVRDPFMTGHSERVAQYTMGIADKLGFSEKELKILHYVVLLHDVGNLEIDEEILKKPSILTEQEYEEVKKHPLKGAEIISKIRFLEKNIDIIKHHHERYDGKGYPSGLQGEDIPLGSRIIAVADAYDAMTSDRPYRSTKTPMQALGEMMILAGKQFDPRIVNIFSNILNRRGEI